MKIYRYFIRQVPNNRHQNLCTMLNYAEKVNSEKSKVAK